MCKFKHTNTWHYSFSVIFFFFQCVFFWFKFSIIIIIIIIVSFWTKFSFYFQSNRQITPILLCVFVCVFDERYSCVDATFRSFYIEFLFPRIIPIHVFWIIKFFFTCFDIKCRYIFFCFVRLTIHLRNTRSKLFFIDSIFI